MSTGSLLNHKQSLGRMNMARSFFFSEVAKTKHECGASKKDLEAG
jgi:hypothetical protein